MILHSSFLEFKFSKNISLVRSGTVVFGDEHLIQTIIHLRISLAQIPSDHLFETYEYEYCH